MFIDTHAHLYLDHFSEDIDQVMKSASQAGIQQVLLPNIDMSTVRALHQLEAKFPDRCFSMMGLHPGSVGENFDLEITKIMEELESRAYIAVGEIGIDLYWDKSFFDQQKEAFELQVKWAAAHQKPIVIHSRESLTHILEILESLAIPNLKGVFHCFTGTLDQAQRIMDLGFYMGIGGVLTFKNAHLAPVLAQIPLSHLLLETDAPYLAPHPFRGKRNESAYLIHIAKKIAEVHQTSIHEVGQVTTENAKNLFHLPPISA